MKTPRWYQKRSVKKSLRAIKEKEVHPVIAVPTGAGKSLILCLITGGYLDENITRDVLILSHRSTILEQDLSALEEQFPEIEIGLYSAGLKSKLKKKITVAGIQSVWRKPKEFDNVGLVLIDEAHLVNTKNAGMYREFLKEIKANYVGLTATPFRLGHGYIYKGKGALFNNLAYDLTSTRNYNKLVDQGFLAKMFSYKTVLKLDVKKVKHLGGDFAKKDLSAKFDRDSITEIACTEIAKAMKKFNLKRGLIFAIDTKHADNISQYINEIGISCIAIHSKTGSGKNEAIKEFKSGKYQMAVGVEMLTTGLDIPEIDMIGLLRPTESASLHVQMIGRGGRPLYAEGFDISTLEGRKAAIKASVKQFCMILDFSGNIARLGPINDVHVIEKKKKKNGTGDPIMKTCPKCKVEHFAAVRKCNFCGHEFEFKTKLTLESTDIAVLAARKSIEKAVTSAGIWIDVNSIEYNIHSTKGKPSSLRVAYRCGFRKFYKYICIDHGYFPRHEAKKWVKAMMPENKKMPQNLKQLFAIKDSLKVPEKIFITRNGKWNEISKFEF